MTRINNSSDAASIIIPELQTLDHEESWVLFLTADNRLLCKEMITKGTLTSTLLDARTILRRALLNNAAAIILTHNHPSGNPAPSNSDIKMTSDIKEACHLMSITLIDHLIISTDSYFSFADNTETAIR
ncbi:MAG: JAB domain-containing protein [Bacteroidales bacterium]|nr:JAB domain-containing protein [Bacteroidales bacterium]